MANNKSPLPQTRFLIVTVTAAVRYTASRQLPTPPSDMQAIFDIVWRWKNCNTFLVKHPHGFHRFKLALIIWNQILNWLSAKTNVNVETTCLNPSSYNLLWVLYSPQTSLACLPSIGLGWTRDIGQTENRSLGWRRDETSWAVGLKCWMVGADPWPGAGPDTNYKLYQK